MSLSLVTGYAGTPHVTATQQGAYNAGTFSKGKYVLNLGNKFAYELISNNLIKIKDGYAVNQGRFLGMDNGDYEELSIDNGLSGVKRSDLIVMRYAKNVDTGIETATMMVVKGTSGDAYTDPEYCSGNILSGAVTDDLLLYRVNINGLSVESVDTLFTVKGNTEELLAVVQKQIDTLNSSLKKETVGVSDMGILTALKCGESITSKSGITLNKFIFTGVIEQTSYITNANNELYLGYVGNGYPTKSGVPLPIKAMLCTQDQTVTQECIVYIRSNAGVYLSVPKTLKSDAFNAVVVNDTVWANFNR